MTNRNKLYSLDEEAIEIMESKPKHTRSIFVREAIKKHHINIINEKPEKKEPMAAKVRWLDA